ncbi:MAG: BamA/TamA family outer membrane protein [candidate division Zixibacteria bacterium]|nr:BamA/TamA family outer membrane protein [candidate division Zixibacteria bacterium]
MRSRVITLLVIFSTALSLQAEEIIRKVDFTGERSLAGIVLYNRAGRIFQPDSLSSDSLKIVQVYQQSGWFDCRVSFNTRKRAEGIELVFDIVKGKRYVLVIDSNLPALPTDLSNKLSSIISLYENGPASAEHPDMLANEIIKTSSDNGYPYCEVRFAELKLRSGSNSLIVMLNINPGPLVTIERIDYPGRENLDNGFLQTYTGAIVPVVYSAEKFKQIQRRLSRAGFIREVDEFELRYSGSPEKGVVIMPIKEISSLLLDGALGYSSNDNEFYGRFNAAISNILGKGRQLKLEWAKKDRSSRRLKLGFTEPYPWGIPFQIAFDGYQDDRDSLFIETGGDIGLHYLSSDIYSYGAAIGASQSNPESYGRTFLPHKSRLKLSVSFTADTRDYPVNPKAGDYLFLKGDFISETIKEDSMFAAANINYRTAELKLEKYLPLSGTSVLFGGLAARGDFSDNVPIDRLFPLGGFGSLRGFMQDIFFVSRKAISTIEYRLLTSRAGRAYIFSDLAVFQVPNAGGDGSETEYKAGFGIGLAAAVKMGTTTIEIAAPGDEGLSSIKLHFGIKAGF